MAAAMERRRAPAPEPSRGRAPASRRAGGRPVTLSKVSPAGPPGCWPVALAKVLSGQHPGRSPALHSSRACRMFPICATLNARKMEKGKRWARTPQVPGRSRMSVLASVQSPHHARPWLERKVGDCIHAPPTDRHLGAAGKRRRRRSPRLRPEDRISDASADRVRGGEIFPGLGERSAGLARAGRSNGSGCPRTTPRISTRPGISPPPWTAASAPSPSTRCRWNGASSPA